MKVTFFREQDGTLSGFQVSGHSAYNTQGEDILCASVSVLVINCINSIEAFTGDVPDIEAVNEEEGFVHYRLKTVSEKSRLLLDSLMLGLKSIEESYGQYIQLEEE